MSSSSSVRSEQPGPCPDGVVRVALRGEHVRALDSALVNDFNLAGLERLARFQFDARLETVAPILGRTLSEVVHDLVRWAVRGSVGAHGLLQAALQENPQGPHLLALAEAWRCLAFAAAPECPYPGMSPFSEQHRFYFFGRTRDVDGLVQKVAKQPLVVLFGASGSGKTSLLNVGLIPALQSGVYQHKPWAIADLRPGLTPLQTLQAKLAQWIDWDANQLRGELSSPLLVLIDQFEEVFTHPGEETAPFFEAILHLITLANVHVLLALRSDYYAQLMLSPLARAAEHRIVNIFPLDRAGLTEAIVEPAESAGVDVEPALAERLVNETIGEPGALPFLQETLAMLWRRLQTPLLTLADYERMAESVSGTRSGLEAAMALHAEETLAQLAPGAQTDLARRIFMRLVQFGEGRRHTRRPQTEAQLQSDSAAHSDVAAVVAALVQERLVTSYAVAGDGLRRFDLAHEKLIEGWPTLMGWIEELEAGEKQRRRLEEKAAEHERLGPDSALLDGKELAEAEGYLHSDAGKVLGRSDAVQRLVQHSRTALNPGWHRLGALLLGGVVLCLALWLGVVYLGTLTLENNIQIAIWITVALLLAAVGAGAWLTVRKFTHGLQHLTHHLGKRLVARWAVSAGLAGAVIGYGLTGPPLIRQVQYCQAAPRHFQRSPGAVINVALVNEGIDPYNADVVHRVLNEQPTIDAWLTTAADAARCPLFLKKVVHLQHVADSTGDAVVLASIDGAAASQPKSVDDSCFAVGQLAYELVAAIDQTAIVIVEESEALLVDSCRLWSLNNEGYAALVAGDLARAERLLVQALQEDPNYAIAHINLGDVYLAQGRTDKALAEYHTAVELAPGEARFNHKLADKYHDLWLNAPDEEGLLLAAKYYQAAITANPSFVEAHSGLANLYIMGGVKLDEAKRHLDSAWAILEGSVAYSPLEKTRLKSVLRKNFGLLAYNNQDYATAITYFEEADALSDEFDIDILGVLGVAYQAIEQHDRACAAWLRLEQLLLEQRRNAAEWLVEEITACKS